MKDVRQKAEDRARQRVQAAAAEQAGAAERPPGSEFMDKVGKLPTIFVLDYAIFLQKMPYVLLHP